MSTDTNNSLVNSVTQMPRKSEGYFVGLSCEPLVEPRIAGRFTGRAEDIVVENMEKEELEHPRTLGKN
eukprot:snap_masked-scaffold_1-processed-gene-16.38-mRNA-1 protein AED:1.00 eAED:1.00 QI:0/-1/0/0/-1/1/1/0/67